MEFLEEFSQEAEELLGVINKQLLALGGLGSVSARQPLYQELLRAFHTLKGLVGMMGLESAGEICHACETTLNRARKLPQSLDTPWLDALLECSRVLARLIQALPDRPQLPEVHSCLNQLRALEQPQASPEQVRPLQLEIPEEVVRHLQEDDRARIHQAVQDGLSVGLAYFSPTPELAALDINVNRVREHLLMSGDLLKAVPLIEGSKVRFAFLCLFPPSQPPAQLEGVDWHGLTPVGNELPAPPVQTLEEAPRVVSNTLRVEVSRLDDIMRLVGELVVSRWRLQNALDSAGLEERAQAPIRDSAGRIERQLRELRQAVTRARMVPLAEVFGRMPLAVRDLARASQCQVRLEMDGEETQVDKVLVERLLDPLLHLVRNALAHGLESPEERERAGKDPVGLLRLSARPQGDSIRIEVSDDGRGLDLEAIGRAAGLRSAPDPAQALDILCRPGFSTRRQAARDAGRGVGMDVVRTAVREMGGQLGVESRPGQGCRFRMRLPLTLTIMDSFLVALADERYAVSRDAVTEVMEISAPDIQKHPGGELVSWRGGALPLMRLRRVLGSRPGGEPENPHALVYASGDQRLAFVVDRVVGLREVVVRPMADPLVARPWLGGATELGDGSMALILDLPQLARQGAGV